jgi:hypothetical protein
MPAAGLLSAIITDKFVYHLPFYRQAQRYEQLGMKIPASTWTVGLKGLVCVGAALSSLTCTATFCYLPASRRNADSRVRQAKEGRYPSRLSLGIFSPEQRLVLFDYHPAEAEQDG